MNIVLHLDASINELADVGAELGWVERAEGLFAEPAANPLEYKDPHLRAFEPRVVEQYGGGHGYALVRLELLVCWDVEKLVYEEELCGQPSYGDVASERVGEHDDGRALVGEHTLIGDGGGPSDELLRRVIVVELLEGRVSFCEFNIRESPRGRRPPEA